MRSILFLIVIFAQAGFIIEAKPARTDDYETIYWQTYHRPPGIIKFGVDQGTGFVEKALRLITQQMPEYNHEYPIASLTRALTDIKAKKNVCHPALFKTKERQEYMLFSKATMISPANRVISLQNTLEQFVDGNYLNLSSLLEQHQFSFSLIKGRSYGQDVDDQIGEHARHIHSQLIPSTDLTALFQMVQKRRVDFTIAYPFELNYYIHKNKISEATFKSYYIIDVPKFTLGYIACPKSPWGEQVIAKVNKVLSETKLKDSYKQAVTSWWGNEQFSKEFEEFYNTEFLEH